MPDTELEEQILHLVQEEGYRPCKPRAIAKQLKVPSDDYPTVRQTVKRLVSRGRLIFGSNHLVHPPAPLGKDEVVGRFQRTAGGFGFVRPQGTKREVERGNDIYVAARDSKDAATGDVVLVTTSRTRRGREFRVSGTVIEVVSRQTHQFVGTYFVSREQGYVRVDGNTFTQPIHVGDPGAKNATDGDKVVIEMARFPTPFREGEAVITEVLGDQHQPGVDTLIVMREFQLPEAFSDGALREARRQAQAFNETVSGHRRDLTKEVIITIDPKDARDFDDAISLVREDNGHWRLGVHIADVSHFVREGSQLDQEARDRATSIYLPDRVIPMIPEVVSNHLASLQPHKVRYTKTVVMEFDADGLRLGADVFSAAIKSKQRFTYEEIDDFLAHPKKWQESLGPDVHRLLGKMHELAMQLRRRRLDGGSLELTMPEIKLQLNAKGQVRGAYQTEYTESHQIIEEFMLAANMAVAEMLRDRGLFFLRRVHGGPTPAKSKALSDFVRVLKLPAENLQNRFELKALLQSVKDTPQQQAVNYAVLRSMPKAVYSPEATGHYALASDCYCHFTSPIRRYPDLTVHRIIEQLEAGKKPVQDFDRQQVLGEHCSDRERRAEQAERTLTKLKLLNYFADRIGERMHAVVTGVESFGLFLQGVEIPAEGLLPIESLHDDDYHFDQAAYALTGRRRGSSFQLGDLLEVEVAVVDLDRRELDFALVNRMGRPRTKETAREARRRGETRRASSSQSRHERFQQVKPGTSEGNPHRDKNKKDKKKTRRKNNNREQVTHQKHEKKAAEAQAKPAKKQPAKKQPAKKQPAKKPVKKKPVKKKPAKKKPAKKKPVTKEPSLNKLGKKQGRKRKSTGRKVTGQAPVGRKKRRKSR